MQAEEQEDVYVVNKLSSATQDDMNRTSPLPTQQKVNITTLFADGLEDIRNGLDAQYSTINSLYWLMVERSALVKQSIRVIMWSLLSIGLVLLAIAVMLGYIIGRMR